jgi:23S rRNA pseudouridine1911/1915/1917 synthase
MATGVSRAQAAELVAAGAVAVGGRPVTTRAYRLADGDVVDVEVPEAPADRGPAPDPTVPVTVVHADDHLVVVDKPPGLVVHPGAGTAAGTLVNGLLARFPEMAGVGDPDRPGIVHRLDKGTSGLLAAARTQAAYERLVSALAARDVERRYLALAWGHLEAAAGLVDAPVGRSKRAPTRMSVATTGKEARTRYRVVRRFDDPVPTTLVECRLETGRTHQIRVHLSAIGHPVVGDADYGGRRQPVDAPRPFLHAAHLALDHPVTGERLAFDSPLPADLVAVLDGLG